MLDPRMRLAINTMAVSIHRILQDAQPSIYLYGSTTAEDYRHGWSDIDLLVRGGVTPLEMLSGNAGIVRAVTTRTTTGGAADATWRELTTILVVDEVIPGIRNALRFYRRKHRV